MSGHVALALITFAAAAGMVLGGVIIELVEHRRRQRAARSIPRRLNDRLRHDRILWIGRD